MLRDAVRFCRTLPRLRPAATGSGGCADPGGERAEAQIEVRKANPSPIAHEVDAPARASRRPS